MEIDEMLRVKEVAQRLVISVSKVYSLIGNGALSHYRIDGAIRVSEDQIAEFLNAMKREARSSVAAKVRSPRLRLRDLRI